ncbi:MAG: (2Fe-2S) ferredoxin domain-containing protein [Anaerolineaceae bacterium]|nr:(2Fe-2S) ferredoxin domain-containing protein [Anaerolineaceae bacterium]
MDEKKILRLCMGSACYHNGAAKILTVIQNKIAEHQIEAKIELMGCFCLDTCDRAVVMSYQQRRFEHMTPENAAEVFDSQILPCLNQADYSAD